MGEDSGRRGAGLLVDKRCDTVLESVMPARNVSTAVGSTSEAGVKVEKCIRSEVDKGRSVLCSTGEPSGSLGFGTTIGGANT